MTPTFPETRLLAGDLLLRPFSAIDIEENQIACADPLIQQWLPLPRFIHAGRVDLVLFTLTPDDLKSQSDHDQRRANTADHK